MEDWGGAGVAQKEKEKSMRHTFVAGAGASPSI